MIETCTKCGQWNLIVFSNRWGERLCQPCLTAHLKESRARALGEKLRPVKIVTIDGIEHWLRHDGPPKQVVLGGKTYTVTMPTK